MKSNIISIKTFLSVIVVASAFTSCSSDEPSAGSQLYPSVSVEETVATGGSEVEKECDGMVCLYGAYHKSYVSSVTEPGFELEGDDVIGSTTVHDNNGRFYQIFDNLICGKKYKYRAYVSIAGVKFYGNYKYVTPTPFEPSVTTGFVDMGTGCTWAACNMSASLPEDNGTRYTWIPNCNVTWYELKYDSYQKLGIDQAVNAGVGEMPSYFDWEDLLKGSYKYRAYYNREYGWGLVSKKDNTKSIFIPNGDYLTTTPIVNNNEAFVIYYSFTKTAVTEEDLEIYDLSQSPSSYRTDLRGYIRPVK